VWSELGLDDRFLDGVVVVKEVKEHDFVWVLQVDSAHLGQLHLDVCGLDAVTLWHPVDLLVQLLDVCLSFVFAPKETAEVLHGLFGLELTPVFGHHAKRGLEVMFALGQFQNSQLAFLSVHAQVGLVSLGDGREVSGHILEQVQVICGLVKGPHITTGADANGGTDLQVLVSPPVVFGQDAKAKAVQGVVRHSLWGGGDV